MKGKIMNIENLIVGAVIVLFATFIVVVGGILMTGNDHLIDQFDDWVFRSISQLFKKLRSEPALKRNVYLGIFAVCSKNSFDAKLRKRQKEIDRGEYVSPFMEVPGTMTFSSLTDVPSSYLTGTKEEMEELLLNCVVEHSTILSVPLKNFKVVSMDEAKQIIRNARPKPVRRFIRQYWKDVTAILVMVCVIAGSVLAIMAERRYNWSEVTNVNGYSVIYKTRFGHVPVGPTFDDLVKDPAVTDIAWSEHTDNPDVDLWFEYRPGSKRGFVNKGGDKGFPYQPKQQGGVR